MTSRLGAIDIGTNSVRLLVADVDRAGEGAELEPLDRRMRITRLGQGVDESRRLRPDAISRTLDVLREYRGALDELGVERARATATSAARDAGNRADFFEPASDVLRFEPELLPGPEEARLSFLGATAGLAEPAPYLVVDIGGGSTEFVVGTHEPEGLISVDTRDKIHHFRLARSAAEDVFRTLATEPAAERRHNPGLEPGRVDVIVGGAVVLVTIMRTFGFDEMLVSEADILDGLVRSIV